VKREKEADAEKYAGEKAKYEAKIKDLEEQIRMLRNESGDIMSELEKKMQMLIEAHEKEKTEIEGEHKIEMSTQASVA
jgi:predicted  nucleic acid-binding Zn-ribbon protein